MVVSIFIQADLSLPMRGVKGITCLISIGAIFFAFYFNNIVDVLIQSYELSVSCLFVPVAMALFRKQGTFMAASCALILGCIGFFLFRIYPIDFPKEIASLLLSMLGYIFGDIVSKSIFWHTYLKKWQK